MLEIFSLDVKKYDRTQKFIFYVRPKQDSEGLQSRFHELNWDILRIVSRNNKYIRLGLAKILYTDDWDKARLSSISGT